MAFTQKYPTIRVTTPWVHSKTGFLAINLIIRNPRPPPLLLFHGPSLTHRLFFRSNVNRWLPSPPDPTIINLQNTIIRNVILRRQTSMILLNSSTYPFPTLCLQQIGSLQFCLSNNSYKSTGYQRTARMTTRTTTRTGQ